MKLSLKWRNLLILCVLTQGCATLNNDSMPTSVSQSLNHSADKPLAGGESKTVNFRAHTFTGKLPAPVKATSGALPAVHVGMASWYGPGFNGRKTANGDTFDDKLLTAAHRSLPLGSRVKVTHMDNGRSVEVEINDRGPYVEGRVIDLSREAAKALDMIDEGIAEVRVEVLGGAAEPGKSDNLVVR